jgi:protoporphyrinogen oxidase
MILSDGQKQAGVGVVVLGAGPAGLTAAYLLAQQGRRVAVLEADPEYVGGISRTVRYKGFHFDVGGHRFFSKSERVEQFWREILPNDFLERPRSSRIYYRGRFFSYPLRAFEALIKLGVLESIRCVLSYGKARIRQIHPVRSFEDWVVNQFGRRLFQIFFKTYTEKVWGMDCKEISADWAAQRIKGLSLGTAIWRAMFPRKAGSGSAGNGPVIKSLIDTFHYPRKGPGMMWEACADKIRALGGSIHMGCSAERLEYSGETRKWRVHYRSNRGGAVQWLEADEVISSAPLREVVLMIQPLMSAAARRAAESLKYREFMTVILILKGREPFADNWIYIHDPKVKVGRIQNFKSWSPEMVPDPAFGCYGLEYFCFAGDALWKTADQELIELAKREFAQLGLAEPAAVVDGCVVRQAKAYPVYDDEYGNNVKVIRDEIESRHPSLHLVGRNGMHKYNNQDHAIMTAMLTVENILAGRKRHDVWAVNQDAEYIEVVSDSDKAAFETRPPQT